MFIIKEGAKIESPLSKRKWKADAIQLETLLMTFEGAFKIAALKKKNQPYTEAVVSRFSAN